MTLHSGKASKSLLSLISQQKDVANGGALCVTGGGGGTGMCCIGGAPAAVQHKLSHALQIFSGSEHLWLSWSDKLRKAQLQLTHAA